MRRKEFAVEDKQEIEKFLKEMTFGFLGTVGEDGWSRVTPLNFVYDGNYFYFHGSLAGEKMKHLAHDPRVSFTVAKEYAIIPSYFTDPVLACPASAFFKSVMVRGKVEKVEDLDEKASVFTLFMEKLQPEGGYQPITIDIPQYRGQLKAVSLCRIVPESITAKFKFGQNTNGEKFEGIVQGLQERNCPMDHETISLMKKYCPHHN
ncbi:Nitroimidazol reductase NimA, pyridoxamine 5'-phosphate oxidase superfamily [Fontibacillus panacisegetis]|uniref:Nitroimidazol reductase NimA, pyridoxamine 5'-phosphate oxidase superfamily n=1 Tax=Fontibacillus panacisegetis TaxID=670482 RepID=A0A1G7JYZ2_9BACL|nr:pyridoxamine 5'-phosphate oxidase family protein [Fontibacillus panacisegetis]SDF29779.1 Nitroimidazol reductase NimA, pyridoxamine 5'-phosphate oxidase superfamily [Fontibacillus panacisegetis]